MDLKLALLLDAQHDFEKLAPSVRKLAPSAKAAYPEYTKNLHDVKNLTVFLILAVGHASHVNITSVTN